MTSYNPWKTQIYTHPAFESHLWFVANQVSSSLLMNLCAIARPETRTFPPPFQCEAGAADRPGSLGPWNWVSRRLERQAGFPLRLHVLWVLRKCWLFTNYQSCFYDFPKGKQEKERFQVYSLQARIKGWPFLLLGDRVVCSPGKYDSEACSGKQKALKWEADGACCHQCTFGW